MSMAMSYHQLRTYLLDLEQQMITQGNGRMPPTILKCNCDFEICDSAECLAEGPFPLDSYIKICMLSWCPSSNQGQFINCYETSFYYVLPCRSPAICNPPLAPLPNSSQLANDYVQSLLNM
ncbi:unnamed protein product [Meganyctiphanes norvegica]|uniref:Uncharacterized protein n=1 Tax=Meganyctiphanes norvegica TaxID=48144 RepID=A0AAV2SRE8_MEGNR